MKPNKSIELFIICGIIVLFAGSFGAAPIFGQDKETECAALYEKFNANYQGPYLEKFKIASSAGRSMINKCADLPEFEAAIAFAKRMLPKIEEKIPDRPQTNKTPAENISWNYANKRVNGEPGFGTLRYVKRWAFRYNLEETYAFGNSEVLTENGKYLYIDIIQYDTSDNDEVYDVLSGSIIIVNCETFTFTTRETSEFDSEGKVTRSDISPYINDPETSWTKQDGKYQGYHNAMKYACKESRSALEPYLKALKKKEAAKSKK